MGNVIRTGFENVDNLLGSEGLKRGRISLICSRPGMGKSTFALNVVNNNKDNGVSALFNYELSLKQVLARINKLFNRDYSKENVFIYEYGSDNTVRDIVRQCVELKKANTDFSLVVIDYMQLIPCTISTVRRRDFNSYILNELVSLAKKCDVEVVVLSQLPRMDKITIDELEIEESVLKDLENIIYLCYDRKDNDSLVEVNILKSEKSKGGKTNIELNFN